MPPTPPCSGSWGLGDMQVPLVTGRAYLRCQKCGWWSCDPQVTTICPVCGGSRIDGTVMAPGQPMPSLIRSKSLVRVGKSKRPLYESRVERRRSQKDRPVVEELAFDRSVRGRAIKTHKVWECQPEGGWVLVHQEKMPV